MKAQKQIARLRTLKSILLIGVMLFSVATAVQANPISQAQARQRVEGFLKSKPGSKALAPVRVSSKRLKADANGCMPYYVFNRGNNEGFVIATGDDAAVPVIGYTEKGTFNYDKIPDALRLSLDSYAAMVAAAPSASTAIDPPIGEITDRVNVPQMLTTQWDQGAPYNNLCPQSGNTRCYTGCLATAMAQVLFYWRNDAKMSPYVLSTIAGYTSAGTQLADVPRGTTINWSQMSATPTTSAQQQAVAELMLYCGQSINMQYSTSVSTTITRPVAAKFKDVFGFSSATMCADSWNYSDEAFEELIYNEMVARRPVVMSGTGSSGHAFVIDGYNTSGYYHVNWGWSGVADGNYLLTALNPQSQGAGGGSSSGYSNQRQAIIYAQPDWDGEDPNITTTVVTIADKDNNILTYGSATDYSFTTNNASGLAEVVVSAPNNDIKFTTTATNFSYGSCLGLTNMAVGAHTLTITAPAGYVITGYNIWARVNTWSALQTIEGSGQSIQTSTDGATLNVTGLSESSVTLTVTQLSKKNDVYFPNFTVTLQPDGSFSSTKAYTFVTRRGYIYAANATATTISATTGSPTSTNPLHQWTFVKFEGKDYLYNIGTKRFATFTGTSGNDVRKLVTSAPAHVNFVETGDDSYPVLMTLTNSAGTTKYFNINNDANRQVFIDGWSTMDDGNRFAINEVGSAEVEAYCLSFTCSSLLINSVLVDGVSVPFGTKVVLTSGATITSPDANHPITSICGYSTLAEAVAEGKVHDGVIEIEIDDNITDLVNDLQPYFTNAGYVGALTTAAASSLASTYDALKANPTMEGYTSLNSQVMSNLVPLTDGGHYRLINVGRSGRYMKLAESSDGTTANGTLTTSGEAESSPSTIFKFEQNTDGETWKVSVEGLYVTPTSLRNAGQGNPEVFNSNETQAASVAVEPVSVGVYALRTQTTDAAGAYLHDNGYSNGDDIVAWAKDAPASHWYIIPAETLTLSLKQAPSASYTTTCLPFPVSIQGTAAADHTTNFYILLSNATNTTLTLTRLDQPVLPAGTAALLRDADGATTLTLTIGSEGALADATGNVFIGRNVLTPVTTLGSGIDIYAFSTKENAPKFFPYIATQLAANKAFYAEPKGSTRVLAVEFGDEGEVTALDNLFREAAGDDRLRDLSGRLVSGKAGRGVYILNGKKVYVK